MFDIITFGSGTQDIFLNLSKENYRLLEDGGFLGFRLGEKILVPEMHIETGGGGTNTAATFALQELKTAWIGKVGVDKAGENLVSELEELGIDTQFIEYDPEHSTALSVILSADTQGRTILVNRGACHFLTDEDIPWGAIKQTKWFYIAPLYEDIALLQKIVDFGNENKIKIALNPGKQHLEQNEKELKRLIKKVDVLLLNMKEARSLVGARRGAPAGNLRPENGILVITKGKQGSVVFKGENVFESKAKRAKVVEKTGAGDAFCSGFVAGLIKGMGVDGALALARDNAAGCIQQLGAKKGLLATT